MQNHKNKNGKNHKEKPVFVTHDALPGAADEKKHEKQAMEVLKEIYEGNGDEGDITKLERAHRRPAGIIIGLLVFFAVLALAAWAGFFIFKPYGRFEGRGVSLDIRGPDAPKAGETVEYAFTYKNTERVPLASFEMRLVIPDGFHILELPVPPTNDPYTWTLGSISSGHDDRIRVRGYFIGPGDGETAFQAIATYRPSNFNADFQAITTKKIILSGTVLEITTSGPTEAAPGEEVTYSYKLKNTGTEKLNFEARLAAPAHFLYRVAEPKPSGDVGKRWKFLPLDPGAETELKLTGSFASDVPGPARVAVSFGMMRDDEFLAHREDGFETNVLTSALTVSLVVNGSHENGSADFGDTLHISLAYKNPGSASVGDVVLSLSGVSDPVGLIDWAGSAMGVVGKRALTVLSWTKREVPALSAIAPGAEGTVDLSLPITSTVSGSGLDEIRLSGSALVGTVGGRRAGREVQTTPLIITLNSDAAFGAEARYFDTDGAPLGSGPLPPTVGRATNLRVVLTLRNTRHDLENVRVRTTLPSRVVWTSRTETETGRMAWDPASRAVTWNIDRVSRDRTVLTASFEVQVTPEFSDFGKFMTLTNETTFEARDVKTGTTVSSRVEPLTTDMQFDPGAIGKGIVTE